MTDKLTLSRSFTTDRVGCAPTPNQYRILSTSHSIFFSLLTMPAFTASPNGISFPNTFEPEGRTTSAGNRRIGSYSPSFSRGRAFRALVELMATRWKYGLLRTPCRASRSRTTMLDE